MANSFVQYTGDGSTTAFSITFDFIDAAHLACTVNGVGTSYTLSSGNTVATLGSAPANGAAIQFTRTSSQGTRLTDYVAGSVLKESDLDTDSKQGFFMGQEAIDTAANSIQQDSSNFQWTAQNKRIGNMANPVNAQDGVTKNYLENTWLSSGDKANLTAVAAKTTQLGLLGTSDAVADMNTLGTADVVSDMNTLGSSDVVSDMNTLATSDVVSDMNTLATADIVSDMNTLATTSNVNAMDLLGTSANVTSMGLLGTTDCVADMNTLGTADVVSDLNTLGSADVVNDMNILATSDVVADMNTLATTANVNNLNTVSGAITNVNSVGSNLTNINAVAGELLFTEDLGSITASVSTGSGNNIDTVAGSITNVNNVGSNISNVNTVAGNNSNINTVAGISSNITSVAGVASQITSDFASDVNTLATSDIIADLNTLATADIVSDLNTLATTSNVNNMNTLSASGVVGNIATVSGDIANVNTLAGISSDVTSAASNSSNITSAVSNASNINSAVSNASNINSVAGNETNINAVNSNSANINTVASANSNINSVAGDITNVNTVASNIAGVNSFADRYRIGSSDPTSSLDEGDLAYNSTDNALKFYNGTSWASISAGLTDIVGDSTPQLGGNLDLNSNNITGTGAISCSGDLTIDTDTLKVDSTNNRVGIGTTNPTQKLHVKDTTASNTSTYVQVVSGNTGNAGVVFGDSDADLVGGVLYSNADNALRFFKNGFSEAMRIDSSGNVGIGTTSPSEELHISKSSDVRIALENTSNRRYDIISGDSGEFRIFDTAVGERIRIDNNGNVGIGTSNPTAKLTVSGDLIVDTIDGTNLQIDFGSL